MADHENPGKINYLKKTGTGELVPEEIPTVTFKKGLRFSTLGDGAVVGSYTPSGTAPLRLTRLKVSFAGAGSPEWGLVDREGTFEYGLMEAPGEVIVQGGPKSPIAVALGTFNIYSLGSFGAGTYSFAWEGVR